MRRFGVGLVLPVLILAASCGAPERVVRQAASLEEAQKVAADTDGLIVVEFWRDG
jgi:hypothetical protein